MLLPFPVPAQVKKLCQDEVMGHHDTQRLFCQFLSAREKQKLVSSPCTTFFQVKIRVIFKPTAEATFVTGSPHLQASSLTLLKCAFQKSPDLHAGVKGLWWNTSASRSVPVANIILSGESSLIG